MMKYLPSITEEIRRLGRPGKGFKPHKHLLLLAVIKLVQGGRFLDGQIYFDDALREQFRLLLTEHGSKEDRNRPYTPFFHLSRSALWKLVPYPGREAELENMDTIGGPAILADVVQYAQLDSNFLEALQNVDSCAVIETVILNSMAERQAARDQNSNQTLQRLILAESESGLSNPFVAYLNSLQRLDASNENALAEYQACNESFTHIHVDHPLMQVILAELQNPKGRQIILTGHAGDGKTVIALDVYKQLTGRAIHERLKRPLQAREDLPNGNVTIIKDLSERHKDEDEALVQELFGGVRRFLIVSNTGALLELLCAQASAFGISSIQMESDVLSAISAESGEAEMNLRGAPFLVLNLARMDNLGLARQIFTRMLAQERWSPCDSLACRNNCPICLNVDLINHQRDLILDRIFLAYRRIYEYGTRLTLRQLTEHLAYLITSGMEETDLAEMREKLLNPLKAEFMFFNRFFGDNGREDHTAALQMQAVREIRNQGFGERPCPTWERKLWLKLRDRHFRLGVEDCETEFELLRNHGSGPGNDSRPGLTPDQAREQVRRMLFFLYDFSKEERSFLIQFLNSPTILRWQEWQKQGARLEMLEKSVLEQRIFHVLQEHFTGVRLPEGATGHDRRLYITLSRGKRVIRQSAQVVLAQVDWSSETALDLVTKQNVVGGIRTDLELQGRGRIADTKLVLTLPFLDYVTMRHFGEVGEVLRPAYVERLEQFKAQVQKLAKETRNDILLVRLKTDHTFRRQQYTVRDGKLEVNDVL